MNLYKKYAFTLVELIVVITILAILGTIAFISLQGYSKDSRNSVRISDIKTTESALELHSIQTGKYPLPDNNQVVTKSGSIDLWNKGDFSEDLLRILGRISELPKDPKTEELMGYATTLQQNEYELKYDLEFSYNSQVHQTQALDSNSYVKGNYNGLFVVGANQSYYSTPGLFVESEDVTSTGTFDLHQIQTQHYVNWLENESGSGITTSNISENQKDFALALKTHYENNEDLYTGIYQVLENLEETNTGQLIGFTEAVITGKVSSLLSNQDNIAVDNTVYTTATGGIVTIDGDYKVHTFNVSGTFEVTQLGDDASIEYLVIAGGGGGAGGNNSGGGGGAGGYRSNVSGELSGGGSSAEAPFSLNLGEYPITVGTGGAGAPNNTHASSGTDSIFSTIVSIGGGGGGIGHATPDPGYDGGSGGGGSEKYTAGGLGTINQGYDGGPGDAFEYPGGGGGGAGEVGGTGTSSIAGKGGDGVASSITGTSIMRAGGGGGGTYRGSANSGGTGGGGNGGKSIAATAGTPNTGGGGGGGGFPEMVGADGGSGVVILRYRYK